MKRVLIMYCYMLVASLEMMSLVFVTANGPLVSYAHAASHQAQIPSFPQASLDSKQKKAEVEVVVSGTDEGTYKVLSRLGSRPPSCKHKCHGCIPCNAIQIPAISGQMGLHYTNYEPEGWKCKCGSYFFNP